MTARQRYYHERGQLRPMRPNTRPNRPHVTRPRPVDAWPIVEQVTR